MAQTKIAPILLLFKLKPMITLLQIDRGSLRWIEWSLHQCAAACCSDVNADMAEVALCVERCEQPAVKAQQKVQKELAKVTKQTDQCVKDCQSALRKKTRPGMAKAEIESCRKQFENCYIGCHENNSVELAKLLVRLRDTLSHERYSASNSSR